MEYKYITEACGNKLPCLKHPVTSAPASAHEQARAKLLAAILPRADVPGNRAANLAYWCLMLGGSGGNWEGEVRTILGAIDAIDGQANPPASRRRPTQMQSDEEANR